MLRALKPRPPKEALDEAVILKEAMIAKASLKTALDHFEYG
jgi:hypothetical protein